MAQTITLLKDAKDENGRQRRAGDSFTCSNTFADAMVNENTATYLGGPTVAGRFVISSAAPSDSDGRPDGTIYIQTTT